MKYRFAQFFQGILHAEAGDGTSCANQPTVGLVVSVIKQNIFLCTNSPFFVD
jgi:hypothetical protein